MKKCNPFLALSFGFAILMMATPAHAKSLKQTLGQTENGKTPAPVLQQIRIETDSALAGMGEERLGEIVANPEAARNDQEKLAALAAREYFMLIDKSGSMGAEDPNPATGRKENGWTRWDSARVATESVFEVVKSLDRDGVLEVALWSDNRSSVNGLHAVKKSITQISEISELFRSTKPDGSTPLAKVLEDLYQTRLKQILDKNEPFTVLIFTDGTPSDSGDEQRVKNFFKKVIRENLLEQEGRETLAAFSFVRMGDDPGAIAFLQGLDDTLVRDTGVSIDIVDTKEDNFVFGTGQWTGKQGVGVFALLWDAIFD